MTHLLIPRRQSADSFLPGLYISYRISTGISTINIFQYIQCKFLKIFQKTKDRPPRVCPFLTRPERYAGCAAICLADRKPSAFSTRLQPKNLKNLPSATFLTIFAPSEFESPKLHVKQKADLLVCFPFYAPGEIRTPDLLVRSQALYPAELRAHIFLKHR